MVPEKSAAFRFNVEYKAQAVHDNDDRLHDTKIEYDPD